MLSDNKKIFFKPNRPLDGYENYIPDAVLLDHHITKDVFIEIFGFNSNEYREERENKINLVKKLEESHHLIYWDALDGEPMPTIEYINSELNSLKI